MLQLRWDGFVEIGKRQVQWYENVTSLRGLDDGVLDQKQTKVAVKRLTIRAKTAGLLYSVDARLDHLPELPDIKLQYHFVACLRRHVGGQ
ncbi:hypothetical protein D3C76_1389390 [compost metagenome]